MWRLLKCRARLAQLVERQPFKLVVVGSSPTVGEDFVYVLNSNTIGSVTTSVIHTGPVA